MTDSLRFMGAAVTLGEMPFYEMSLYGGQRKPKTPLPRRVCSSCLVTVLSRHNTSNTCYPCQDRLHAAGMIQMTQTKAEQFLEQRLIATLEVAKSLAPVFSVHQLAIALNVRAHTAQGVLRSLRERGDVRQAGQRSNKNGKMVATWSLV